MASWQNMEDYFLTGIDYTSGSYLEFWFKEDVWFFFFWFLSWMCKKKIFKTQEILSLFSKKHKKLSV